MKKRLGSLLLAFLLTAGIPAAAADINLKDDGQTITADDSTYKAAVDEDPETYRATHRGMRDEPPSEVKKRISKTMLFANSYIPSIYNKKSYLLPDDKNITHGIDVSYHNGSIDWKKVKNAGTQWAILRVGYTGYGSGKQYKDTKFDTYIRDAAAEGIPVGVYIYSQADSVEAAKAEAQFCLDNIRGYNVTLPIVMDVEFAEDSKTGNFTGILYNAKLSKAEQTEICEAFCKTIQDAGYTPMIYASKNMFEDNMNVNELEQKYPIWLANYTTATAYKGDYAVWQYADTGAVSGIDYAIDCNFGIDFLDKYNGNAGNTGNSTAVPNTPNIPVSVSSVAVSEKTLSMTAGSSTYLTAEITPSNAEADIKWESSDSSVVSVSDSGEVTAVGCGTAVVTASSQGKKDECAIIVKPAKVELTSIDKVSGKYLRVRWNAAQGASKYYVYRSESGMKGDFHMKASTTKLSWKDTGIESDKRYYYRVKAVGMSGGQKYDGKVSDTFSGVAGTEKIGIKLSSTEIKVPIEQTSRLTAETTPEKSVIPITWKSSDETIASVDDTGTVTGYKIGASSVSAEFCGVSANCSVSIVPEAIEEFSVKLDKNAVNISWNSTEGAKRYYVYRSETGKDGSWGKSVCSTTKKSFCDKDVEVGKIYYYRMVAAAKADDGKYYRSEPSPIKSLAVIF